MRLEGFSHLHLAQYLSSSAFIDSPEDQSRETARKPMIDDGFVTVCSSDVQSFIAKTTVQNISIPGVVSMLCAVGATMRRCRGKFSEQSRWYLPVDTYPPSDYNGEK